MSKKQGSRIIKDEDKIKEICDLYVNKKWNLKLLGEKYGTTPYVIKNILLNNNIEIIHHPRRKGNFLIEDFFHVIDSEEKAYFLGLLFTDGNVYKSKKYEAQISLELHVKDKDILEKFKEVLNSNAKISYRKRTNTEMVCFRIFSDKMAEDLAMYGVIPNKTKLTKHMPNNIPQQFKKDFARGMIDGDGGFYYSDKYLHLTFCSYSYNICQELQNLLNELINEKNKAKILKDKNKEIYRIHYNAQKLIKQLVTVLYKDSNFYLTRKYAVARDILEYKSEDDIVCE